MTYGAIILCGGKSARMGRDKATLPFGPDEVMLQRVVRLVGEVVEWRRIVIVASTAQKLPELPEKVRVTHDRRIGRGPLEGLAAGLRTAQDCSDAAFVASCDAPMLVPAFVERLFRLLGGYSPGAPAVPGQSGAVTAGYWQIVVPREGPFHHPLAAVYRTGVLPAVEELLATDRLRLRSLFETCRTLEVPAESLRDVDPELDSLANCNSPEAYSAALAQCGLEPPVTWD